MPAIVSYLAHVYLPTVQWSGRGILEIIDSIYKEEGEAIVQGCSGLCKRSEWY